MPASGTVHRVQRTLAGQSGLRSVSIHCLLIRPGGLGDCLNPSFACCLQSSQHSFYLACSAAAGHQYLGQGEVHLLPCFSGEMDCSLAHSLGEPGATDTEGP